MSPRISRANAQMVDAAPEAADKWRTDQLDLPEHHVGQVRRQDRRPELARLASRSRIGPRRSSGVVNIEEARGPGRTPGPPGHLRRMVDPSGNSPAVAEQIQIEIECVKINALAERPGSFPPDPAQCQLEQLPVSGRAPKSNARQ